MDPDAVIHVHVYSFLLVVICVLVWKVSCQQLNNTLHSTEYGVHFAYESETVTFTCVTRGSNSIAWSSDEYIGADRMEFASAEREGTTRSAADSGAIGRLVSVSNENGNVILVSQLQLNVQSTYQIASITCHNIGIDAMNTTTFLMAGKQMSY